MENDLISRQAAIELIERMKPYHQEADDIAEMIANMPSAQPKSEERTAESTQNVPNDELISRKAAIDALRDAENHAFNSFYKGLAKAHKIIADLPSAQPEYNLDEWCTDCKEYDHERHCCPRWNRVIRETLKDAQPEEDCDTCKHGYFGDDKCNNCRVRYPSHYERRTDEQTD